MDYVKKKIKREGRNTTQGLLIINPHYKPVASDLLIAQEEHKQQNPFHLLLGSFKDEYYIANLPCLSPFYSLSRTYILELIS